MQDSDTGGVDGVSEEKWQAGLGDALDSFGFD